MFFFFLNHSPNRPMFIHMVPYATKLLVTETSEISSFLSLLIFSYQKYLLKKSVFQFRSRLTVYICIQQCSVDHGNQAQQAQTTSSG